MTDRLVIVGAVAGNRPTPHDLSSWCRPTGGEPVHWAPSMAIERAG